MMSIAERCVKCFAGNPSTNKLTCTSLEPVLHSGPVTDTFMYTLLNSITHYSIKTIKTIITIIKINFLNYIWQEETQGHSIRIQKCIFHFNVSFSKKCVQKCVC